MVYDKVSAKNLIFGRYYLQSRFVVKQHNNSRIILSYFEEINVKSLSVLKSINTSLLLSFLFPFILNSHLRKYFYQRCILKDIYEDQTKAEVAPSFSTIFRALRTLPGQYMWGCWLLRDEQMFLMLHHAYSTFEDCQQDAATCRRNRPTHLRFH